MEEEVFMVKKSLIIFFVFLSVCCAPLVRVPPGIDLLSLEKIGLITFNVENAEGALDEIATQHFLEELQRAQQGIRIIEIGKMDEVLAKVRENTMNPQAAEAIGEEFGVSSFFFGKILVSDIKPKIDIASIVNSLRVRATFDVFMSARLVDVDNGAILWTDSVDREGNLAYLHLSKGMVPSFTVRDQDKTYRGMINQMIRRLTIDLRPTLRRLR